MIHKKIFISYAREDASAAQRLYDSLRAYGAEVWFDVASLKPGVEWKREIVEAIRDCRYFLAVLSTHSVTKKGYVQKELKEGLDVLDEYPFGETFIIPIRLDECHPTYPRMRALNWLDLFPDWEKGIQKLIDAIDFPLLRFDGVYYVHPSEDSAGQVRVFRFFEDGSVFYDFFEKGERIMVPPRDHRSSSYTCTGRFTVKDKRLFITTKNIAGNVDFEGEIKERYLSLKWFSHINSTSGADVYRFHEVVEDEG